MTATFLECGSALPLFMVPGKSKTDEQNQCAFTAQSVSKV